MVSELIIFWTFMSVGILNLLHYGFYLCYANIYDIWQFKRAKNNKLRRSYPLVSIVIAAFNEEKVIERTLTSLTKLRYPKLQIIVVDDGSADSTRKLIRQFIAKHPRSKIELRFKRKNVGKGGALNHGMQFAKGEFIMTLDADSLLQPMAVNRAIPYFDDPNVAGVAANVRIIEEPNMLSLLQMLEHLVGYRSKKAYSMTNSEIVVGGVGSTYRASVLKAVGFYDTDTMTEDIGLSMKIAALGNKAHRLVYAVDVVAMTEGVSTFKALLKQRYRWKYGSLQNLIKYRKLIANNDKRYTRMLTYYRIPMAFFSELLLIFEPVLLLYILYISYLLQSPASLIGSYIMITVYLTMNLLPDEHSSRRRRMRMLAYAPIAYFLFYIMNVVQVAAMVRSLLNSRGLFKRRDDFSNWTPPERSGVKVEL